MQCSASGPLAAPRRPLTSVDNRAGVKATPHVLRHTAAVHMAEDGVPMEEIAR